MMRLDVARAGMLVRVFRKVLWGLRGVPPAINRSKSGQCLAVPIRTNKKDHKIQASLAIVDR